MTLDEAQRTTGDPSLVREDDALGQQGPAQGSEQEASRAINEWDDWKPARDLV
ncbi:hypothetical protein [Piscinibacter sp. XHJ-5]|uniref:hypothetical protein n=1 Tax=Piscinibacter sp. XHJ-5 TaxID=3037797 RepID=UPI002452E402|nr:hypothetical protein [Piscinibacter sp. XHJ-5]